MKRRIEMSTRLSSSILLFGFSIHTLRRQKLAHELQVFPSRMYRKEKGDRERQNEKRDWCARACVCRDTKIGSDLISSKNFFAGIHWLNILQRTLRLHLTIVVFSNRGCHIFHAEEKIFIFGIEFVGILFQLIVSTCNNESYVLSSNELDAHRLCLPFGSRSILHDMYI